MPLGIALHQVSDNLRLWHQIELDEEGVGIELELVPVLGDY